MAVNQGSLSFYPPRWQQRLTPSAHARSWDGTPVQIANAVPVEDAQSAPVSAAALKSWLSEHGFSPVAWGRGNVFERGQVQSIFGPVERWSGQWAQV